MITSFGFGTDGPFHEELPGFYLRLLRSAVLGSREPRPPRSQLLGTACFETRQALLDARKQEMLVKQREADALKEELKRRQEEVSSRRNGPR